MLIPSFIPFLFPSARCFDVQSLDVAEIRVLISDMAALMPVQYFASVCGSIDPSLLEPNTKTMSRTAGATNSVEEFPDKIPHSVTAEGEVMLNLGSAKVSIPSHLAHSYL
mgnify:CR=1 FL=1|jgi:hypothetical protein